MTNPRATPLDLGEIERRTSECTEAVNREGNPMGRMMAWATHGVGIIRTDIPALVAEVRRLQEFIRSRAEWMHNNGIRGEAHDKHSFAWDTCNSLFCVHARAALGEATR